MIKIYQFEKSIDLCGFLPEKSLDLCGIRIEKTLDLCYDDDRRQNMRRKIYENLLQWKKRNGKSALLVQGARFDEYKDANTT